MRTTISAVALLALFTVLPGRAAALPGEPPLFTRCMKVELQVRAQSYLDEEVIRSMAESRLRSANLYRTPHPTGARNYMSLSRLNVEYLKSEIVLRVSFDKYGSDIGDVKTLWETIVEDDSAMRDTLAEILDHFVLEYRRANRDACERRENQR